MSLNDLQCKNAQPRSKTYFLADGEGLFLQVLPSGGKYWRYKFRLYNRHRILALGVYPTVTIAQARERLLNAKRELSEGKDPILLQGKRKQLAKYQANQTFKALGYEWLDIVRPQWSKRYAAIVQYRLETYLFPALGRYPVTELTPSTLLACLEKVEKNSPDMARRLLRYVSRIFLRAVATGRMITDFTPSLKDSLQQPKSGSFNCIEVSQLPKLLTAIHKDAERSHQHVNIAMRLMLLTFVRTTELIAAKWPEIDFENAMWTIPAERMKMKRDHLVPLAGQTLALLNELKANTGKREYLFPSVPNPKKPMCNNTLLVALKRMGFKGTMTGHGFRSLAMTIALEELEYDFDVIDRQLAHVPSGVRKSYDRAKYLRQRRQLMQDYADYIDNNTPPTILLKGKDNESATNQPTTKGDYPPSSSTIHNRGNVFYLEYKPFQVRPGDQRWTLPQG